MECEWSQKNRFESRLEALWEPHTAESNRQKSVSFKKMQSLHVPTVQMQKQTQTKVVQNGRNLVSWQ